MYAKFAGEGYLLHRVNPETGIHIQEKPDYHNALEFSSIYKTYSSDKKVYAILRESNYGGPSTLFTGNNGNDEIKQIVEQYDLIYSWVPDTHALIYLYYEEHLYHLVRATANGNIQQQHILQGSNKPSNRVYFAGWSADHNYFALVEYLSQDLHFATIYLVQANTLSILSKTITSFASDEMTLSFYWAPTGHQYAALISPSQNIQIVIGSPEQKTDYIWDVDISGTNGMVELPLEWSPDGRYIAIRKRVHINEDSGRWEYWKYQLLNTDTKISITVNGERIAYGYSYAGYILPTRWWAADSKTFIFRQQIRLRPSPNNTSEELLSYLVEYHPDDNHSEILASDVAGAPVRLNQDQWLAIPIWVDGKVNVGLLNTQTHRWQLFVEGIDSLDSLVQLTSSPFNASDTVVAVWEKYSEQYPQTYLSWMTVGDGVLHTIAGSFERIQRLQWLPDNRSFLYIGKKNDRLTLSAVDLATSATLVQMNELPANAFFEPQDNHWQMTRFFVSPSGRNLIFTTGLLGVNQTMYLASLDQRQIRKVRDQIVNQLSVVWADNDEKFAFVEFDQVQNVEQILIFDSNGNLLNTIPLNDMNDRGHVVLGWVPCDH